MFLDPRAGHPLRLPDDDLPQHPAGAAGPAPSPHVRHPRRGQVRQILRQLPLRPHPGVHASRPGYIPRGRTRAHQLQVQDSTHRYSLVLHSTQCAISKYL